MNNESSPKTLSILVVDDSDTDAEIVGTYLEDSRLQRSYRCTRARDLLSASEQISRNQFHAILLDLGLPDSYGLNTAAAILQICNAPVIILSGNDDEMLAMRAVQEGAQDYLLKDEINPRGLERSLLYAIERHLLKQTLKESIEKAEAANRAKSEFLAVMSHEFRTPMNGIIGSINLLNSFPLSPEQQELLDTMQICAEGQMALIGDVLDISRIEAGKLILENQPFATSDLVNSVVKSMNFKAKSKGIELVTNLDPNLPSVITSDEHRVRQVLVNLVGNAIKFTERGEVCLKIERLSQNRIQFTVKDTGIGIAQDKLKDIFSPFTQVDSSYERRFQGTGLGLAICQRLVTMLGGKIQVSSILGQGSEFRFTIENRETAAVEGDTAEHTANTNTPLKILLIEDDAMSRNMLVATLAHWGYQTDTAFDGLEGIEKATHHDYDLILIDLQMPRIDGIATAKQILHNSRHDPFPPYLTAVTACANEDDRTRCTLAGMKGFIPKPISRHELKETLAEAAAYKTARIEAQKKLSS